MKRLTKEFSHGRIVYRMPNVVEAMEVMGRLGYEIDGSCATGHNTLIFIAGLMKQSEFFIVEIDATIDGVKVTSFQEALQFHEFKDPIQAIGLEIMMFLFNQKKAKPVTEQAPAPEPDPEPSAPAS